ncbi:MAG: mucoidy inhibitor MuiA family protein [Opitutaceae bacterium]|nr:mucoidy inhibitor MuiA family protein [Opitutaceae bacterium]
MNLRLLPHLLAALVATTAFAAPIPADSSLTAATVYTDRAVLTRTASALAVPSGTSEITFSGLPASLLDDSVQVTAKGTTAASLLDIATRTVFVTAEPDARIKALDDQLAALRREERALNDQSAVLESQRALVGSIEKVSTTPVASRAGETAPARPTLDDYEKLLGFSATQRARLDAAAQKLDVDRTALAEKISAAQSQLNELRGKQPGRRANKTVTVRLSTESAGKLDVALSYTLPGAGWTPAYDARLRSEKRQVQLDAFGVVRNATGEDWKNITLTLSTARPGLGGSAPEIFPWYVDVSQPVTYGKMARSSLALDKAVGGSFNNSMMVASPAPAAVAEFKVEEATYSIAAVETAATSASFKIATPVTLASDNTPQRVPLGSATFSAELQYQATPKLQETAYLAAYVTNRSELPFLAGALNVFLDDTFVATSRLATTMPGEKFTLNLGADEGISIKRKIVSRFTEDTGFTTKSRRTTYDILVTVTNNKRTAERVVIKDAAPVPRDEKIIVKILAPAERDLLKPEDAAAQPPKIGIARDADGKLTWRYDLKPGEKREIPLKFSIEHPADLPVTGVE